MTAADDLGDALPDALKRGKTDAVAIASGTALAMADAIRGGREAWRAQIAQLVSDLENPISNAAELAAIKGALIGENLRKGLKSKDPQIKARAEAIEQILLDRYLAMSGAATTSGAIIGQNLADALRKKAKAVAAAAAYLGMVIAANLKPGSPTKEGPLSRDGGIGGWGGKLIDDLASGMAARIVAVDAVAARAAGSLAMPGASLAIGPSGLRSAAGAGGGANLTMNVTFQSLTVPWPGRGPAHRQCDRPGVRSLA